jgi:hypothetical protein
MATFLLDSTGDFDTSTGRITVTTTTATIYKQKMDARLNAWLGEWYQDRNKGFPWFQKVLVKNPNMADVQSALRKLIASVPGTTAVEFTSWDFNRQTRVLSVEFRTLTNFTDQPLDFNWAFDLSQLG